MINNYNNNSLNNNNNENKTYKIRIRNKYNNTI